MAKFSKSDGDVVVIIGSGAGGGVVDKINLDKGQNIKFLVDGAFIFGLLILPLVALYSRSPHIREQI